MAASHALMELFHLYPAPFVWALQRSDRVWRHCARLIRGDERYVDVVGSGGPLVHLLRPLEALASTITSRRYGRPRAVTARVALAAPPLLLLLLAACVAEEAAPRPPAPHARNAERDRRGRTPAGGDRDRERPTERRRGRRAPRAGGLLARRPGARRELPAAGAGRPRGGSRRWAPPATRASSRR